MKVLLVNGSPHEKGCTYTDLKAIADQLAKNGIDSEIHWIGSGGVPGCRACGCCKTKGECEIKDQVNELGKRVSEFDGFVFGSPVYYSGPAGQLCAFMDRFFYTYGGLLDGKVGACIVNARRGGNSASFERLNQYLLICNMVVAGSQYWNLTHGNKPEEVVQDLEGQQTMRVLADNIAWILKCIDAGRKAGIEKPAREPRQRTSFIR